MGKFTAMTPPSRTTRPTRTKSAGETVKDNYINNVTTEIQGLRHRGRIPRNIDIEHNEIARPTTRISVGYG